MVDLWQSMPFLYLRCVPPRLRVRAEFVYFSSRVKTPKGYHITQFSPAVQPKKGKDSYNLGGIKRIFRMTKGGV